MPYAVVIEKAEGNCSGYVPDLYGCVATGSMIECGKERVPGGVGAEDRGSVDTAENLVHWLNSGGDAAMSEHMG